MVAPPSLSRRSFLKISTGGFAVGGVMSLVDGCIGKKGAPYAACLRGFTNVWGVSRSWTTAAR